MGINDRVKINITGPGTFAGTATSTGTYSLSPTSKLEVTGRIIGDFGDKWLVELDIPIAGNKRIYVPKINMK